MGELEMDSRPFPAPLPHSNPVPFSPPSDSRLRPNYILCQGTFTAKARSAPFWRVIELSSNFRGVKKVVSSTFEKK